MDVIVILRTLCYASRLLELCLLPLRSNWYTFVSLLQVTFKLGLGSAIITDDQIRGTLRVSWKPSSRDRCSCVLSCIDLEHG
jgi:hypothetical protein